MKTLDKPAFYLSKHRALPHPPMQEEFAIPLDEPVKHADLLLSVSLLLFEAKGPDFFLPKLLRENS